MPPPPLASRSHRDNRQHFHKGRQGRLLVPHGEVSGLLFSVNPRQESHALREAREYCTALTEDLQRACTAATTALSEEVASSDATTSTATASTSALLAAELAAFTAAPRPADRKRAREDGSDGESVSEDDDGASSSLPHHGHRGERPRKPPQWFSPLETNCKGYILLSVPVVRPAQTCVVCHAGAGPSTMDASDTTSREAVSASAEGDSDTVAESKSSPGAGAAASLLPPHSIVLNPLVSIVVERIFRDLMRTPRPVFKNCFRLFPVELTCCPTVAEMQKAVQVLLCERFPRVDGSPTTTTTAAASSSAPSTLSFTEVLPFYESHATHEADSGASLVKSMYKITLQFAVKNNTNVEKKKSEVLSALQAAIPANRFILLRGSSASGKNKIKADASLFVSVLHATCVMGVQMHYEDRSEYNVHAIGERAMELSNTVTAMP